ncbi:ATP-dependent DNA helicase RecQ [Geitlerinema sp. PCC 7407]|uniref:RecQ family ATP-dependent DNA helicase n=1 Tax=Geitlerinema sp. PCC 7407 TaxID=1173025 RepID=UPI00029FC739|nr:ATP-dependent DNA helicase RecQ [Geitlerinema sp. PCC 7407]AFY65672.1 ATP-dependent DNA helicase RecQ [Geitlerinema sp. PCC 7407]
MHQAETPEWEQVRAAFQAIWGYPDFRPPQGDIVRSLLAGRDALVVMPTGGGKSICFQLPALMQRGLTLVVSPLVALMENQVQELRDRQLPAALLHSERSGLERKQVLRALEGQSLRLLYLSPETLLSPPVWERLCRPEIGINGLILDEAHCLVQWGETFRPAYRRLGAVRSALLATKPPGARLAIAAFTATADPAAQRILREVLGLRQPAIFRLNPYRANLSPRVQVAWSPRDRRQKLVRFVQAHPGAGLVYVRTRRDSEELSQTLRSQGFATAAYHAGLGAGDRRQIEADWQGDRLRFVVCTNAFGMGVNKPNVRWVAHFQRPQLLSEYVQEIGRAGRDGQPAQALTLVSEPTGWLDPSDRQRQAFFAGQIQERYRSAQALLSQIPRQGRVEEVSKRFPDGAIALALLHSAGLLRWRSPFEYTLHGTAKALTPPASAQDMTVYLKSRQCRWRSLLQGFGFDQEATDFRCGHCDNCQRSRP